jgi:hypothetical protein
MPTDMTKLTVAFRNFAYTPKNSTGSSSGRYIITVNSGYQWMVTCAGQQFHMGYALQKPGVCGHGPLNFSTFGLQNQVINIHNIHMHCHIISHSVSKSTSDDCPHVS